MKHPGLQLVIPTQSVFFGGSWYDKDMANIKKSYYSTIKIDGRNCRDVLYTSDTRLVLKISGQNDLIFIINMTDPFMDISDIHVISTKDSTYYLRYDFDREIITDGTMIEFFFVPTADPFDRIYSMVDINVPRRLDIYDDTFSISPWSLLVNPGGEVGETTGLARYLVETRPENSVLSVQFSSPNVPRINYGGGDVSFRIDGWTLLEEKVTNGKQTFSLVPFTSAPVPSIPTVLIDSESQVLNQIMVKLTEISEKLSTMCSMSLCGDDLFKDKST